MMRPTAVTRPLSILTALFVLTLFTLPVGAQNATPNRAGGEVSVPLQTYEDLLEQLRQARGAPAGYAVGATTVRVRVSDPDSNTPGEARVEMKVRVLEERWALVPVLPAGVAVAEATADGSPVALIAGPEGLLWSTDQKGDHTLNLRYPVDAVRSGAGVTVAIPIPHSPSTRLEATLPGTQLDVAVVPAQGVETREGGGTTNVTATIPPGRGVQLSWRAPELEGHALSRALYRGRLEDDAIYWNATFQVDLFSARVKLPLFPVSVTVQDVTVDGKSGSVLVEDDQITTLVTGRGTHEVKVSFVSAVLRSQGPPSVKLQIPEVPVSRFELTLPGRKDLTLNPPAPVESEAKGDATVASVSVPMCSELTFTWAEAVPVEVREEVRANASFYHLVHAEEGVLHVRALATFEITRGETNTIELEAPTELQINRITSPTGALSDWRAVPVEGKPRQRVSIFLDRKVKGDFPFEVEYERLYQAGTPIVVPLLRAVDVHRQRGMVALLQSPELTLNPQAERGLNRVGENQLPPEVRQAAGATIAHTYKYTTDDPELSVEAAVPERKPATLEAEIDTLISIGEVSLKGAATIGIDVKSGSLMELGLRLPTGVNVLSVTGPSIRTYDVKEEGGSQLIQVAFTQDMEAQFRLEVAYERILAENEAQFDVPTVSVDGSQVEHGRIAIEALAAVEVTASAVEQMSLIDVSELPQQLVLKTTNPILLSYRYAHPPHRLALQITRHREIEVQAATIDTARYQTLYTRDGLAVTIARFQVRNIRKPFLEVKLPPKSKVWSALVDGKGEKPAAAANDEKSGEQAILIKLINSAEGFPVELVYATEATGIGALGSVSGRLPRPDIVVTHSRWDVYLPAGPSYGKPDTGMDVVEALAPVDARAMEEQVRSAAANQPVGILQVQVPAHGIHFAFEKLYANQAERESAFSIPYSSATGARIARSLAIVGTLLLWAGIAALTGLLPLGRGPAFGGLGLAVALLLTALKLGAPTSTIVWASVIAVVALGGRIVLRRVRPPAAT